MKNLIKIIAAMLLLTVVFCFASCEKEPVPADIWDSAIYTEDVTLGEGETTLKVEVKIEGKTVVFTLNTNADTVGAALLENGLIAGEEGAYGLYIKIVNGVTADYDIDQSYWAFWINGEYAMSGVDTTEIKEGDTYTLEYTK